MPVRVNFLEEEKGVEILETGVVLGREIIKAKEEIINNAHLENIQYQLIDESSCTEYNVTADDIENICEFDRLMVRANPNMLAAVVKSKTLRFSLTELWQLTLEEYDFKTNRFNDRKAALEWINEHIQQ